MASGRTVSASLLTELDEQVLGICEKLSSFMLSSVREDDKADFEKNYAKIHKSRDAGTGRGGGKLQRDALCTRGRVGKAPFSNRNFRWHPLVVADQKPMDVGKIDCIKIEGEETLVFCAGKPPENYPSDIVYKMSERFVVLPEHWIPYVKILENWDDIKWSQNSCVISAMEATNWWDAVESYAVLGMSVAINLYGADFAGLHEGLVKILRESRIEDARLPSENFPVGDCYEDITKCPVCKKSFNFDLSEFRKEERQNTWQPVWAKNKKSEGDDSSIQIMHVTPLIESQMRHNAKNVRYGHRWCNVAMADHSLEETLDFMQHVVNVHNRRK